MNWKLELARQSAWRQVPFARQVRALKRKLVPYSAEILPYTLEHGFRQLAMLEDAELSIQGCSILELGAGWQPVIPLLFHFAGCGRIYLVDRERLIDRDLLVRTIRNFADKAAEIASRLNMDPVVVRAKCMVDERASTSEILDRFDMEYMAPVDITAGQWSGPQVDLVLSREVLEYLRPGAVGRLFSECGQILKANGAMCHIIDNSDHWEHVDRSLSRLNFLKYEDALWRCTGLNPLHYLNRLRHFEYVEKLEHHGYSVLVDESRPYQASVEALSRMRICSRYQDVPLEDLAVLTSYLVAAKRPAAVKREQVASTGAEIAPQAA